MRARLTILIISASVASFCIAAGDAPASWDVNHHAQSSTPYPVIERDFLSNFGGDARDLHNYAGEEGQAADSFTGPVYADPFHYHPGSNHFQHGGYAAPLYVGPLAHQYPSQELQQPLLYTETYHHAMNVPAMVTLDMADRPIQLPQDNSYGGGGDPDVQHYPSHRMRSRRTTQRAQGVVVGAGEISNSMEAAGSSTAVAGDMGSIKGGTLTGSFDDDYWYSENRKGVKKQDRQLRLRIAELCRRKGLWVGMPPRELAASLAEVKVEIGLAKSKSIGLVAARYVRDCPQSTQAYVDQVQEWGDKITKKLGKRDAWLTQHQPGLTPEERASLLIPDIRFIQDRKAYLDSMAHEELDKNEEAARIWDVLLRNREMTAAVTEVSLQQQANLYTNERQDENNHRLSIYSALPMDVIERASREIHHLLPPYNRDQICDFLRRFLFNSLHKTAEEVDVFNKARNDWLKARYDAYQSRS